MGRYEHVGSSVLVTLAAVACGIGMWLPDTPKEAAAVQAHRWIGISLPSKKAAVGPAEAGVIREMPVREGDFVKSGDLLFRLDRELEELESKRLDLLASSDAPQREAAELLAYSERRFLRLKDLNQKAIANPAEFELAEHDYHVAKLRVESAQLDSQRSALEAARGAARLAQRTIHAPQAGVVSKIFFQAGEPAEKLIPVVEVVTLDPLWIEFDCPVDQSAGLAVGSKLSVRRAVMGEESRSATVIFTSMTADASSHSTRVRLELPNDPPWRAGLQIWIEAKATAKPPRGK